MNVFFLWLWFHYNWISLSTGEPRVISLSGSLFACPLGGHFHQFCDGTWLRFVNRMAARDLDDLRARALGHELLSWRWNHLVLRGDQIPTRLALPCCLFDRSRERHDTPRHLRVCHERGSLRVHDGSERGGELPFFEKQKAIL